MMRARKAALAVTAFAMTALAVAALAGTAPSATAAAPRTATTGVPWSEVGPGWVLDEYTVMFPKAGPAALYLFSPQGARYRLASWPDSDTAPQLLAWSPDGKRALLVTKSTYPRTEQLTLATGKTTTFALPRHALPVGYAPPRGTGIVGYTPGPTGDCSPECDYYRYSQDGTLAGSLGAYPGGGILYSADGNEFAVGGGRGLELVSSNRTVIRQLAVPGMVSTSCDPVRWWNGGTILADCQTPGNPGGGGTRLWLVPADGARPTVLTAPAPGRGDIDAWRLPGGLYTDFYVEHGGGTCAQVSLSGGCRTVSVPGLADNAGPLVVTAAGSWLLIAAPPQGFGSSSGQLLWFDPATHAERWLIRVPVNVYGNSTAIPFFTPEGAACYADCF
jgi:TolB protein